MDVLGGSHRNSRTSTQLKLKFFVFLSPRAESFFSLTYFMTHVQTYKMSLVFRDQSYTADTHGHSMFEFPFDLCYTRCIKYVFYFSLNSSYINK